MATVFIVDDDAGYRGLVRALLEEKGHKVEEAADGSGVLRQVEQMNQPPNLFILDLRMPGVGGYELAMRLREHEKTRDVPILLLSGDGEGVRDLAEREGVSYLQKLVASNEEIVDHATRLLQRANPKKAANPSGPAKPLEIDRGFRTAHPAEPEGATEAEEASRAYQPPAPDPAAERARAKHKEPEVDAPKRKESPEPAPSAEGSMQLERLDEIVLALLWLNQHMTGSGLKSFDERSLERLHKAGLISHPKAKSKWVVLSEDAVRRGKEAFLRHFGLPPEATL